MSQYDTTFDLKINLGHSDLYINGPVISLLEFFALKNILVLLAKLDSGELRCPATALIITCNMFYTFYHKSPWNEKKTSIMPVWNLSQVTWPC